MRFLWPKTISPVLAGAKIQRKKEKQASWVKIRIFAGENTNL